MRRGDCDLKATQVEGLRVLGDWVEPAARDDCDSPRPPVFPRPAGDRGILHGFLDGLAAGKREVAECRLTASVD